MSNYDWFDKREPAVKVTVTLLVKPGNNFKTEKITPEVIEYMLRKDLLGVSDVYYVTDIHVEEIEKTIITS